MLSPAGGQLGDDNDSVTVPQHTHTHTTACSFCSQIHRFRVGLALDADRFAQLPWEKSFTSPPGFGVLESCVGMCVCESEAQGRKTGFGTLGRVRCILSFINSNVCNAVARQLVCLCAVAHWYRF